MRRLPWMLVFAAACLPAWAHAAPPCGTSSPLLAIGTEARDSVRLGEQTLYRTTTICRNGVVTQTSAVRDTRAYAPFYSARRDPAAQLGGLAEALAQGRIGVQGSCTLPAVSGRDRDLVKVAWFGAHGRENHVLFLRGESNLFPVCSASARALFDAIRTFENDLAESSTAETLAF